MPHTMKLAYVCLGAVIGVLIMGGAVIFSVRIAEREASISQCWDPPAEARRWAYPEVVSRGSAAPLVCARRVDNNGGVMPHSHRCVRMVPCE